MFLSKNISLWDICTVTIYLFIGSSPGGELQHFSWFWFSKMTTICWLFPVFWVFRPRNLKCSPRLENWELPALFKSSCEILVVVVCGWLWFPGTAALVFEAVYGRLSYEMDSLSVTCDRAGYSLCCYKWPVKSNFVSTDQSQSSISSSSSHVHLDIEPLT